MPDTHLILHVKGTEAQTTELPRNIVRAAISQGQITQSQLIWCASDYAWKQVREIPELLPDTAPEETLILHVKGTEAETRELPKKAVRAAVSQGQITHTQLIWSPADHAWKQVRELPELLPEEILILHVKGTEAETRELPKQAVRIAVSQGQITHTQLIWSSPDQAWKQVRELPELLPGESLILHVKGTEAETRELPKQAVQAALSQGQITHSQLIWNPADQAWKQVRELPELLPSQKLAPAPSRETAHPLPMAVDTIIPESPSGPVARAMGPIPRARVASAVQAPPKVRVASASTPRARVASAVAAPPKVSVPTVGSPHVRVAAVTPALVSSTGDLKVKEENDGTHTLKWVCIGLGLLILLFVGGNYLLVDQPLVSNLDKTSYSNVTVYAHFGAFIQPSVVLIHISPSSALTQDNLTDFIVALAHSTPRSPITGDIYSRVALTSGWTAQYSFSGSSWKELGDMRDVDDAELKEALLARLADAGGLPVMPESTLDEAAQQAARDQVWQKFAAHFIANP